MTPRTIGMYHWQEPTFSVTGKNKTYTIIIDKRRKALQKYNTTHFTKQTNYLSIN